MVSTTKLLYLERFHPPTVVELLKQFKMQQPVKCLSWTTHFTSQPCQIKANGGRICILGTEHVLEEVSYIKRTKKWASSWTITYIHDKKARK